MGPRPFVVVFDLEDAVIVNPTIALDGLLARRVFERTGDADTAHTALPLASRDGIWSASELAFDPPARVKRRPYVSNPSWAMLPPGALVDGRGKPRTNVVMRDDLKPTMDAYTEVSAACAFAFGQGNVEAVRDLLTGLESIGKKATSGYGRVSAVRVTEADPGEARELLGFLDPAGNPARAIPIDLWHAIGTKPAFDADGPRPFRPAWRVGPARPHLPRWKTATEVCAMPAGVVAPHGMLQRLMGDA